MNGLPIRQRWKQQQGADSAETARVAKMFAALRPAPGLSDEGLERAWAGVMARAPGAGTLGACGGLKLLVALAVVGAAAGWALLRGTDAMAPSDYAAIAAERSQERASATARPAETQEPIPPRTPSEMRRTPASQPVATSATVPGPATESGERRRDPRVRAVVTGVSPRAAAHATTAVHDAARVVTAASPASAMPPQGQAEDDLAEEAKLLERALRSARAQNDAPAALELLDVYESRFPEGKLRREALLLRVEALVQQAAWSNLLRLLEARADAESDGDVPLRLLRGEVLSDAGRFDEALATFDRELGRAPDDEVAARALWGRANALAALGRMRESRQALQQYMERFPAGAKAGVARLMLAR